jgi:hypothetical protein
LPVEALITDTSSSGTIYTTKTFTVTSTTAKYVCQLIGLSSGTHYLSVDIKKSGSSTWLIKTSPYQTAVTIS